MARKIDKSSELLFDTVLQKVQHLFVIKRKLPRVVLDILETFEELNNYNSLFIHKVTELKGKNGSFIILLLEKHSTVTEQSRHGRITREIEEMEPVLLFTIPYNLGKAYIREETVGDKIADLFYKVDIDFEEYPKFSKNYLVVGEKPDLVRKYLPKGLPESLEKMEALTIEINGHWGLVRPTKNLTEDVLLMLLSIGYNLSK